MVTAQLEVWNQIKQQMHMRRAEYQSLEPYPYPLSSLMNPTPFPGFVWGCSPAIGSMKWGTWIMSSTDGKSQTRLVWEVLRSSLWQIALCNQARNSPCCIVISHPCVLLHLNFTMFIPANLANTASRANHLDNRWCYSICTHIHPM